MISLLVSVFVTVIKLYSKTDTTNYINVKYLQIYLYQILYIKNFFVNNNYDNPSIIPFAAFFPVKRHPPKKVPSNDR